MDKMQDGVRKIIYIMIFALMGVQIALGSVWICANFCGFQEFSESRELLEISHTWVLDEYVGIGYPFLITAARVLENLTGISYTMYLYAIQLISAFWAGVYFLGKGVIEDGWQDLRKRRVICYGSVYFMTIPMLAQIHLAVLPFSLAFSGYTVMLAECAAIRREPEKNTGSRAAVIGICWFCCALLIPDYGWFGGILAAAAMISVMCRRKKICFPFLLSFVLTVVLIITAAGVTQEPGSRGKIQKSLGAAALSRFVWPNFDRNNFFWDTCIKEVFDLDKMTEISHEPEKVATVFGPGLENAYGKERAEELYLQMAQISLELRTRETVYDICRDAAAYICPQLSVQYQLAGKGVSYTGWNYNRMGRTAPHLTKYYVQYALKSFNIAVVLAIASLIWNRISAVRKRGKKQVIHFGSCVMPAVLSAFMFILWYTMSRGGMQDYRNVPVICMLWAALIIKGWEALKPEYEESEKK